jgi:hypothetical protein
MDQNIALTPAFAALLAACLGAALGWASLARKRPEAALAHAGVAAAIAMAVDGAMTLRVWALSRLGSDHAMSTVIVGVCLVGVTIALRGGSARVRWSGCWQAARNRRSRPVPRSWPSSRWRRPILRSSRFPARGRAA